MWWAWQEYLARLVWQGKTVADYVPWARVGGEGVVQLKTGGLLRTYTIRGMDWQGETRETIGMRMMAANDALRRIPGEWTVHSEALRARVPDLPPSVSPYVVPRLLQADHCQQLLTAPGVRHTQYFLSITWTPLAQHAAEPDAFVEAADECLVNLRAVLADMRPLSSAEQLTYLKATVSSWWQAVAVPEGDTDLDVYLCDSDWDSGAWREWDARLGTWAVRVLTLTGYPARSWAGMLRDLDTLAVDYRWCTRWSKIAPHFQDGILQEKQKRWEGQEFSLGQRLWGAGAGRMARIGNEDMVRKTEDLSAVRQEVAADILALGHFATALVTWGATPAEAETNLHRVQQVVQRHGFVVRQEGAKGDWWPNHVPAWLATHPGNTALHLRKSIQTSLTAAHLMPGFQTSWPGPARDEYLDGPPWFVALTEQSQLVRIVNHVRDIGLFQLIGPTGSGKSTTLWWLAMAWTQYRGARITAFDKDRSGRLPTLLMGGQWHDLGALSFQPLRHIDTQTEREWALHWLLDLCAELGLQQGGVVRRYLLGGLERLADATTRRLEGRTLSGLATVLADQTRGTEKKANAGRIDAQGVGHPDMQLKELVGIHNAVRNVLLAYTGGMLDGCRDPLEAGAIHTFELATLLGMPRLARPVLQYVYHWAEQAFSTETPTLMPMDEAAVLLLLPGNEERWRDLMLKARKFSVSLGLCIHNLDQVFGSPLGPLIVGSFMTRFFFPDTSAKTPYTARYYEQLSLVPEEIRMLATARPNRDIYYSCEELGKRLFQLPLSRFALDCVSRNSQADHGLIDRLLQQEGREGFPAAWLEHHGYHDAATQAAQRRTSHEEPATPATLYPVAAGGL